MKGYQDIRVICATNIETKEVFDGFDAAESERPHRDAPDERTQKIARLKAEVNAGTYKADVMDIARLLTSAMDPTL